MRCFFELFRDVCGGLYGFSIKFGKLASGQLLAGQGLLLELLGALWLAQGLLWELSEAQLYKQNSRSTARRPLCSRGLLLYRFGLA